MQILFTTGSSKAVVLGVLITTGALLASPNANAFCRQRSCDILTMNCYERDSQGCSVSGEPTWLIGKISLWVDEAGSPRLGITGEAARVELESIVSTWMDVTCNDGAPPELDLVIEGTRPNLKEGFDRTPGVVNVNSITFVDKGWTGPKGAAAFTRATMNQQTGEIVDVDIQINSEAYAMAFDPGPGEMSLRGILTHEVGHLIGLDHSKDPDATMLDTTVPAETSRMESLAPDDIAGVCAIYETAPVRPMQTVLEPDPAATPHGGEKGCAVRSPAAPHTSSEGAVAFALAVAVARRRRTRRASGT